MPNNVNDSQRRFIYDKDRLFTVWNSKDIFTDKPGGGRYCPNENDMVINWDLGIFRVTRVDYTTGLSVVEPWQNKRNPDSVTDNDVLLGRGPGRISESFRAHVDKRGGIPYVLDLDSRLRFYHPTVRYIKIFRGFDIQGTGEVVGMYYNAAGQLVGENIPLKAVEDDNRDGTAKAPVSARTHTDLKDGEVLTVVSYTDTGNQASIEFVLVNNTSLTRPLEAHYKYVTGIRLISPFMSESEPNVFLFPKNINTDSVPIYGIVEYQDGTTSDPEPVGRDSGSRFAVYGLNHFVPTQEGIQIRLTANYVLRENEYSYLQDPTTSGSITERYLARVTRIEGAYSLKLFVYPTWVNPVIGYNLEFFLYDIDRRVFYKVPDGAVRVTDGFPAWNGLDFIRTQRMSFSMDIRSVNPQANAYHHVQVVDITLRSQGTELTTNWTVNYNPPETDVIYGEGLKARVNMQDANYHTVDLRNGASNVGEWLQKLYRNAIPLRNTWSETDAPTPDHFTIRTKRRRVEYPLSRWTENLHLINDLETGETLYIEWFKRTVNGDLQLGISGLPVLLN